MEIPAPYTLVLLALGGFRLVRLIGWDTITEPARKWLTGYSDDGAPSLGEVDYDPATGDPVGHSKVRVYVSTLVRCPWCVGFWLSLALYGAWLLSPRWVGIAMIPLALSASFGLIAKNLDP